MPISDIVRLSTSSGVATVPSPEDYESRSAQWTETEYRIFGGQAQEYFGGYWTGEPGSVSIESWPYDETCVILSGHVAVVDREGGRADFHAGDAFFIPQGFSGSWLTLEPTHKVFVAVSR